MSSCETYWPNGWVLGGDLIQLNRILEIKSELRLFRGLRTCHRNQRNPCRGAEIGIVSPDFVVVSPDFVVVSPDFVAGFRCSQVSIVRRAASMAAGVGGNTYCVPGIVSPELVSPELVSPELFCVPGIVVSPELCPRNSAVTVTHRNPVTVTSRKSPCDLIISNNIISIIK